MIQALTGTGQTAAANRTASSSSVDPNLFSQILKARLDSALLSMGTSDGSTVGALGGTGGLMDTMLMGTMLQQSRGSGLDGAALQELITQLKQPQAQTAAVETAAAAPKKQGGVYVSRVYTPESSLFPVSASWPQHTSKNRSAAVSALTRVGDPYSQSKRGQGAYVDCSYLTQWAYRQQGISLPAIASEQARWCIENNCVVPRSDRQVGDLVFWTRDDCSCGRYNEVHHVGIYLGDDQVIEASSSQGKVVINDLWTDDDSWHLAFFGRPA